MTAEAVRLLAALLAAHFVGDFTPLANARIQKAKARGGPMLNIVEHAGLHALLVAVAVAAVAWPGPWLLLAAASIELVTHFLLDAFRSRLAAGAPALSDPSNGVFWTAVGLDQLAHTLILVGIAAIVL